MSEATPLPSLRQLLKQQPGLCLTVDDLLFVAVPLLRAVAQLHAHGRVATLGADDIIQGADRTLHLRRPDGIEARANLAAINAIQPMPGSALNIVGELRLTSDAAKGVSIDTLDVQRDVAQPPTRPALIPGFGAWELLLGHHDENTDIFQLGQLMACLALGLDFDDVDDVIAFATHRKNLFEINERLNPVLANVLVEMTALNRHERATDLPSLMRRLETYREQPVGLDVERVLTGTHGAASRRTAVFTHLRDRLFDLSRRNRLLHFRATQSTVNLTVASVPLVMQIESIRADQLCTWGGEFASQVLSGKQVALQRWLRFEDQPYLPVSLDRIIQETRRDRAEYGFSHLRLVVAFLRWHNLKETPEERIVSPLLWLPVELVRKKGVRDQYILQCEDAEAEFNPALRHHLRQLYDIELPETVDLGEVTLESIHADLSAQIKRSEPGVELRLQTKPAIELIHQKALQRLQQFNRRRGRERLLHPTPLGRPDFSYEHDDFRPLGLALFRQRVQPSPLPLRDQIGAAPRPRQLHMAASAEREHKTYALQEDSGHRYAWDLDLTQVTLANFNYKKMSLVRDYAQLIDEGGANVAVDRVFSIEPRELETAPPPPLPLVEQWNVVPADATQNAAVQLARSGRSFIIQGPPGTGKSQTITNLIADYAARGKRVLFVCEKRAALDVVFHRLKQSGLDELCCLIHDSQGDKKAFVGDLRDCYGRWVAKADQRERLNAARVATLDRMGVELKRIDAFEQAMVSVPEALACSVRSLIRRSIELPPADPAVGAAARERLPDFALWDRNRELTARLVSALKERFGIDNLAQHPFAQLSAQAVAGEQVYADLEKHLIECEALLDQLDAAFEDPDRLLSAELSLADARVLADAAQQLLDSGLAAHPGLLQSGSPAAQRLHSERAELGRLAGQQQHAALATLHWVDKLTPDDASAALVLLRAQESSLLRWLQPSWWRLRGELQRRYDFSKHAVRPSYSKVVEALAAEHAAVAALVHAESELRTRYTVNDLQALLGTVDAQLQQATAPILRKLHERLAATSDPVTDARREASARAALHRLVEITAQCLAAGGGITLGQLAERVRDLREHLDDLPDFVPILQAIHSEPPAYAAALQQLAYPSNMIEALIARESLARLFRKQPELARFDDQVLSLATRHLAAAERRLLGQNAEVIRETLHLRFLDNVRKSSLSATQLDSDGRAFKKAYATGRRELEHEFGKSMRYRSIRDLAGDETGLVVNDLKPIWLMSPLSVSDTLPMASDLFDVVVFDEASQIPTEEAVPAMSRARQVVVVGDEMQLPPTSFFSAAGDEDDSRVVAEEDGERIAINLDADSLLNQAARNLPATLLAWHYRSRYEALISFSNAAFYDGRLITIPEQTIEGRDLAALSTRTDAVDAAALGVDGLMARPVSFLRVEDGVYVGRRNEPEARYIASLVRELLRRETGMSLGVVAFSEAQQAEIETALEALAAMDTDFATRLEREYTREDDDQFNGLFVKNLENVQGDERDIILLSICYAPGPDGRMLMNFGPINQRGGEKRLNVIFSRARHRMAVVSTIHADAITNTHNDGAAALKSFLQFAEASSRGEVECSQAVLGALNPGAQQAFSRAVPKDAFRTALARALKQRGHQVHEYVGRSQFRCDLAISAPSGGGYALAILLDAELGAQRTDVRERYVFRPNVLRAFGWRVIDVLSSDWLRNPTSVLDHIEARLLHDEPTEPVEVASSAEPDADGPPELPSTSSALPDTLLSAREFTLQQGTSNKFWRIATHGTDLIVVFGRVGSKGQTLTKSFDTPERAERELEKLVDEKVRKGYVEMGPPNMSASTR